LVFNHVISVDRTLAAYHFFPAPLGTTVHDLPANLGPTRRGCLIKTSALSYWYLAAVPRGTAADAQIPRWFGL
jgi:hypothetical protein